MALLLCLALQETRVTLELRDIPLIEAAARALEPFGHTAVFFRYEPDTSRRVNLSLRDAGYLETLDVLGDLAAIETEDRPDSNDHGPQMLLRVDLTPSLRLSAHRESFTRKEVHLTLRLLGLPGPAGPSPRFEGRVSGIPFQAEFLRWGVREGDSIHWKFRGLFPFQRAGEMFRLDGTLFMGDGRRVLVLTDPVVLPIHPEFPDPAPTEQELWLFLIGGLAVSLTLIFSGVALLRIKRDAS